MSPPPTAPTPAAPTEQEKWFSNEVHAHDGQLKAYLRGSFPAVRDVDDIVQESYLRVWKARAVRPIQSAKAFLFTVARHLALRVVRRETRGPVQFVGDLTGWRLLDHGLNPVEALGYREKVSLLAEALTLLPPRCREVVILRKLQCLPQKEVAAQLGLSERTVENQLAKGVARCRQFFHERGVETLF